MRATALRVNARRSPTELDDDTLRFSWQLTGSGTAAESQVVVREEDGGELWRSPVLEPGAIAVSGEPPLEPGRRYRWHVEVDGAPGDDAVFATGLRGTWTAAWIARDDARAFDATGRALDRRAPTPLPRSWRTMYSRPPLQLRARFTVARRPVSARLYVTARGVYRAFVNGARAGEDELTPGWTDYTTTVEYQSYEVGDSIRLGENVLSAIVADGWWSGYLGYYTRSHAEQYGDDPQLIAELHLHHADGSSEVIRTGEGWRERSGEIVASDLLMGEYHDPQMATPGWQLPGFDDTDWRPAVVVDHDTSMLVGQRADPVRIHQVLDPVEIRTTPSGAHLVDFGQVVTGHTRLVLRDLPAGRIIELRHGDAQRGGELYTENLRSAEARDIVVADGRAESVFEPAFTFHGFRYLEIVGGDRPPRSDEVSAVVLSSLSERTGHITSSVPLIDRIVENTWWSQLGNFLSVPTDCPQRDERLGWTADIQVFAPTACYLSDADAFLDRWLRELDAAQAPSGAVPNVAPVPPRSRSFDSATPGWGDAATIVPWTLYRMRGDRQLLERHLPHMKAWVDFVAEANDGGPWRTRLGENFGDWLSAGAETPPLVVSAAYQIRSVDLLARSLRVVGRDAEAERYEGFARALRNSFERDHVAADGRVDGETQTGYLFALAWDLVPEERRAALAAHLVDDIESRGHLTTGFMGVSLLCPTLHEIGRGDLAVDLLLSTEYPSWGYSITHGATTIWERWDGWTADRGFQDPAMNSFNHYSLGSVTEWIFRGLAGIDQEPDSAGFQEVRIAPFLDPRIQTLDARYRSVRGEIGVSWDLERGSLAVELPDSSVGRIDLPGLQLALTPGHTVVDLPAPEP